MTVLSQKPLLCSKQEWCNWFSYHFPVREESSLKATFTSRSSFCLPSSQKATWSLSSKLRYKDTPVQNLNVIPHAMPLHPATEKELFLASSRVRAEVKTLLTIVTSGDSPFSLLSDLWVCLTSKGQLLKILVRELPKKSLKCVFVFAFQNLSNPDLQIAQTGDVFEFLIPSVVCRARGSFCTLKLCQVYLGFGEPSWELQVRLIVCPYSAVPKTLHSGLDGAT